MNLKIDRSSAASTLLPCAVAGAALLFPALAFAADPAHGHEVSLGQKLLWPAVNFSIYAYLIFKVYRKKGAPALKARRIQIEQQVNRSAQELLGLESELSKVRDRLRSFPEEKAELAREFEGEGRQLAEQARRDALEDAAEIQRRTKEQIAAEFHQLEKEFRKEMVEKAAELARQRLHSTLSGDDDRRLRAAVVRAVS